MVINNEDKSTEYSDRCKEYLAYIDEHVNNVKLAFKRLFVDNTTVQWSKLGITKERLIPILKEVYNEIQTHDESKYSDEEFNPYRERYYPTREEKEKYSKDNEYAKEVDDNFEEAWKHHYLNNSHHPLFWCTTDPDGKIQEIRDIPITSIMHMICDWEAMSMKFRPKNDLGTIAWYINNADEEKSQMNGTTKKLLEDLLEILYDTEIPRSNYEEVGDK